MSDMLTTEPDAYAPDIIYEVDKHAESPWVQTTPLNWMHITDGGISHHRALIGDQWTGIVIESPTGRAMGFIADRASGQQIISMRFLNSVVNAMRWVELEAAEAQWTQFRT